MSEYLESVLEAQTLGQGDVPALQSARDTIEGLLRPVVGRDARFYYGGSYAKNTMLRVRYDLDLVVSYAHDCGLAVEAIYNQVYATLRLAGLGVVTRTVAVRIHQAGGFHIDVVPGRAHDGTFRYASLFVNAASPSWLQTSLKLHIESVKDAGLSDIVRLVKLWAIRHSLGIETFPLEIAVQRAMYGVRRDDIGAAMNAVLAWLRSELVGARLVDPANSNNIIDVPASTRYSVAAAAERAIAASSWNQVVW